MTFYESFGRIAHGEGWGEGVVGLGRVVKRMGKGE